MFSRPLVAIIGGADSQRQKNGEYDPPIPDVDNARQAAKSLGRALADESFRLLVYDSGAMFIDACVVEGFLEGDSQEPSLIQVRYPAGSTTAPVFSEQNRLPMAFDMRPDPFPMWFTPITEFLPH